jgi:hypothetical protein
VSRLDAARFADLLGQSKLCLASSLREHREEIDR